MRAVVLCSSELCAVVLCSKMLCAEVLCSQVLRSGSDVLCPSPELWL